jgi:hypothetical protein
VAIPYVFSYTFMDTNGVKASVAYYYTPIAPSTVTIQHVIDDWHTLGGLLDDASNAKIIDGKITLPEPRDGAWKSEPVEENDVSDVITINYGVTGNRYPMAGLIPNLKNAELDGGRVDLTDADIAALTAFAVAATTYGNLTNTAGQVLSSVVDAFQSDRKHRRQLHAKSLSEA